MGLGDMQVSDSLAAMFSKALRETWDGSFKDTSAMISTAFCGSERHSYRQTPMPIVQYGRQKAGMKRVVWRGLYGSLFSCSRVHSQSVSSRRFQSHSAITYVLIGDRAPKGQGV